MLGIRIFIFTFIAFSLSLVEAARILAIYPVPFHSHQSVFQVLTEELSRQGHELVVITPLPNEKPLANVTFIDVHELSYEILDKAQKMAREMKLAISIPPLEFMQKVFHPVMLTIVDAQFNSTQMKDFLSDENQHFDVILAEACVPLSLMVAAKFDAPIILVSSFFGTEENFALTGTTIHPFIFPEFNLQRTFNLSFLEKFTAIYTYIKLRVIYNKVQEYENRIIKKHLGNNAPTVSELQKNVQMLFLNVHPIWDNNRPVPPSVVYMGGLHLKKPKAIPNDLKTYLDSSKNGVIYVSFGSKLKISDFPSEIVDVFLRTFESLPFDALIKWNGDEIPNKPANIRLEEWLPQNDILHHPKIKAFITQGGLQSTDEAIAAKVPLIALALIADQWYNGQKYVQLGIGTELDINNLTEEDLKQAILTVTENKSYRDNITRLSRIMEEQRTGGLEKAVHWVDYVAKYGALHLRSPLADATFIDYFMLDVLGTALVFTLVTLYLIVILVKKFVCLVKYCLRNNKKLKSN